MLLEGVPEMMRRARAGADVSILGLPLTAQFARQAAEGIGAEVVDVRALAPIDWPTLETSARKTGRVVIVEEGPRTGGVGVEIAASLVERLPGLVVARVASADVPVPLSPSLENAYRPDVARIVSAARRLCGR